MTNGRTPKPNKFLRPPTGKKPPMPAYNRGPLSWLLLALVLITMMMAVQRWHNVEEITVSDFLKYVDNGDVASVEIGDGELTGKFNEKGIKERKARTRRRFQGYHPRKRR